MSADLEVFGRASESTLILSAEKFAFRKVWVWVTYCLHLVAGQVAIDGDAAADCKSRAVLLFNDAVARVEKI